MNKLEAPRNLKILCLLSAVGGLYSIKESIQELFFFNPNRLDDLSYSFSSDEDTMLFINTLMEKYIDMAFVYSDHRFAIHIPNIILCSLALYGVYQMYKLRKIGFTIYTVSKLLVMLVPFIVLLNNSIGQFFIAVQFFITGLFILAYATQLKHMQA